MNKFGFIVLSTEHHVGRLNHTVSSIKNRYNAPVLCVTDNNANDEDLKNMAKCCQTIKGGNTIVSLINSGMANGYDGWNILVTEGSIMPHGVTKKLNIFIDNEKDILFPIIPDCNLQGRPIKLNNNFIDSTLNGLTIHKNTFLDVGPLEESNEISNLSTLQQSKLLWASKAINKECKFKAILGIRIC